MPKTRNSADSNIHAVSLEHGTHGGSTLWWNRSKEAKKYLHNNDNSWNGIYTEDKTLSHWITSTRASYKKNALSERQIQHLKKINFPFDGIDQTENKKHAKLQSTIILKEEWDRGPLPEAKQTTLFKALKQYNKAYRNCSLSESSARKLGISPKPLV